MSARRGMLAAAVLALACWAALAAEEQAKVRLPEGWTSRVRKVKVATPAKDTEVELAFVRKDGPMEFVVIKAGEFLMSSPARERNRYPDEPEQHPARVERAFLLSTCEVTERQYYALVDPEKEPPRPDAAKEGINFASAREFCRRMSERDGVTCRLPTETEWEYACRAGSTTPYYWGKSVRADCAWGKDNSGGQTHLVGRKLPNAWGLYDMSGNVWEWCTDGERGVLRGGSYGGGAPGLRTARRFARLKGHNDYSGCGFRVVVELPVEPEAHDAASD